MEFSFDEFFNLFEPDKTYKLDAFDSYYKNAINGAFFRINKKTFLITEDPDDGYRSSLDKIFNTSHPFENVFHPVSVYLRKGERGERDVIKMINVENDLIVFEFGTNTSDDWYPYFVCNFNPESIGELKKERQLKKDKPTNIDSNFLVQEVIYAEYLCKGLDSLY